jgi:mono/diheme cytochrome c family protein
MMIKKLLLILTGFILASCGPKGNQPNVEIIQDMMEQPALKAQDFHPHDREKSSMLVPPEGSWPKNRKPYLFTSPIEAGKSLKNPIMDDPSQELKELGKIKYNNFCMVCHGETGAGDGPVADKFQGVKPPSLLTDKVKNYPDGQIFHIITMGQGIMGNYMAQLPEENDRWAVVNYVRSLQKK